jgi:hypothetical protein
VAVKPMHVSELNFVPVSELLGAEIPTRPYDISIEELLDSEEVVRTSALCTVPLIIDELPDDAYPTEVLLLELPELE